VKVCLIASPGGHLSQILNTIEENPQKHDFFLCTTNYETIRQVKLEGVSHIYLTPTYWQYQMPFGVILSLLASLWTFMWVFRRERPDFILSTGAEIAIPALLVNRLFFRRPSLFVESLARTKSPSLTGRIVYYLVDRLFVQWPELLQHYGPKAEYHGGLL
jgi:UDP-N-acetylglucosamine:LPS N-acetylglucosamine transferase